MHKSNTENQDRSLELWLLKLKPSERIKVVDRAMRVFVAGHNAKLRSRTLGSTEQTTVNALLADLHEYLTTAQEDKAAQALRLLYKEAERIGVRASLDIALAKATHKRRRGN